MKKLLMAIFALSVCSLTQAQVKMPAPSPTQMIKQAFALGSIELTYSRPLAKGRKIMGDLVPYNKVWRTGANGATIIKFTDPVEILGKKIDTGSYALYTIPGEDTWQIILNKGVTNWGSEGYSEAADVVRFIVKRLKAPIYTESFTMQFADVKPSTCQLQMMWEKTMIAIPISAYNFNTRIRMDLEKELMNAEKKPYWQAAQFYNEYDVNYAKALENINNAVKENPGAYYMWIYKAKIEKAMGDRVAAKASATKSLELSTAAKNDDYIKMNKDLLRKL